MTVGKRALLYLTRKKGRSILLILLVFVMSSFILIGNSLKSSADKEIKEIQNSLGNSFILKEPIGLVDYPDNYEYVSGDDDPLGIGVNYIGPKVTPDLIEDILEINDVTDYFATFNDLAIVDLELKPGLWDMNTPDEETTEEEINILQHETSVIYCSIGNLHRYFRTGATEIVKGRNIQKEDHYTAIISEYLAEKNHLSVGDTFLISTYAWTDKISLTVLSDDAITVKIVGIFRANVEQETAITTAEDQYLDNFIFTDIMTGTELTKIRDEYLDVEYDEWISEYTFFVDNPENIDEIMQQVKESEYWVDGLLLTRDKSSYEASIKPLKQIFILATILVVVGIAGCAIILFLVLTMWIKGRKREVAILLSIGINKKKVIVQMVLECVTVSVVGLVLTFVLSTATINGCCKATEYITAPKSEDPMYKASVHWGFTELDIEKVSSEAVQLDYDLSGRDVVWITLVILAISTGSVLLASNQVMRIKPKELLQMT
ncbi:MAG: FtsX-like permease family protein [Eubacteriales bacterium]|nr:FtsX-like permease family protein [Eubacteriales bacterium]